MEDPRPKSKEPETAGEETTERDDKVLDKSIPKPKGSEGATEGTKLTRPEPTTGWSKKG